MTSRIYTVRLNLDEMAAGLDTMESDKERSAWLRGFQAGCRGAAARWPEGSPTAIGHALGLACHEEARALQGVKASAGQASAAARQAAKGSSQPQRNPEQPPNSRSNRSATDVRTERRTERRTAPEPIDESRDREIQKRESTSPSSPEVSPREDYHDTPTTTTNHPAAQPDPGKVPTSVFLRINTADVEAVHDAILAGNLLGLVTGMGANPQRAGEWRRECRELNIGTIAAIFDWSIRALKDPLCEPSGFKKVRPRWLALSAEERTRRGMDTLRRYGITAPEQGQEAAS